MENIKASVFYDYIYFTLLPHIKSEKLLKLYKSKI